MIKLKSIRKKIFSRSMETSPGKEANVLTILGLKFKFLKTNKEELKQILNNNILPNSILIIEANTCHSECIPGYSKYLSDLGYNVDIIVPPESYKENPFVMLPAKYYNKIYPLEMYDIQQFLSSDKVCQYKYIILNSNNLIKDRNFISFFEFFQNIKKPQYGYIVLEHRLDKINQELLKENRVMQLANLKIQDENNPVCCNPAYFGDIHPHKKNKVTNFIVIGELNPIRRNYSLLFNGINELIQNGVSNFKVTIIGAGKKKYIPRNIRNYINFKGRLPYKDMYDELQKSDFILTLLDPENTTHLRYIKTGTSGSFLLSYGFCKPCIIHEKFARYHYFNHENSVVYDNNENFTKTLIQCINMDSIQYDNLYTNLNNTINFIRKCSLENLENILNSKKTD